jgi:tetratricopeptide (TPR) repeat protein
MIFNWWKSLFSSRGKALSLYRRGMARAKEQDHEGAIDDYTATIDMPHAPPDVKAMARYNRALVYAADEDNTKAINDLSMILAMAETPADIKAEARRKLERMKRHSSKTDV